MPHQFRHPHVMALLFCAASISAFCQETPASAPQATPVQSAEITPQTLPAGTPQPEQAPVEMPESSPAETPAESPTPPPKPKSPISIEIDLQEQKAYLLHDGRKVYESTISSGRSGHLTPTGDFEVLEKDLNHFSNLYGQIVEKESGHVVVAGADAAMRVPPGCKFVPAPMKYFMRFDGAAGMHAGILPGYPASHGCVRMPASKAKLFYNTVEIGSEVHVFGKTPTRTQSPSRPERRQIAQTAPS